jgi:hypothetical protein
LPAYSLEEEAMKKPGRYILSACFFQEKLCHVSEESRAVYQSKEGKRKRV